VWLARMIELAFCALLVTAGLVLFTNYRQITYRMSWVGLRMQGYTSVPERLVREVRFKTRIGRLGGLFLMIMGAAGAVVTLASAIVAP
jgi:hypothetical protein